VCVQFAFNQPSSLQFGHILQNENLNIHNRGLFILNPVGAYIYCP